MQVSEVAWVLGLRRLPQKPGYTNYMDAKGIASKLAGSDRNPLAPGRGRHMVAMRKTYCLGTIVRIDLGDSSISAQIEDSFIYLHMLKISLKDIPILCSALNDE